MLHFKALGWLPYPRRAHTFQCLIARLASRYGCSARSRADRPIHARNAHPQCLQVYGELCQLLLDKLDKRQSRRLFRGCCRSYSDGETCTNAAESFFSRIRRAEIGVHHKLAGNYLGAYAAEMAWREDNRRRSNGAQFLTW
jgi:hypothetical protein